MNDCPLLDKAQKRLSALKTLEQAMSTSEVEELSSAMPESPRLERARKHLATMELVYEDLDRAASSDDLAELSSSIAKAEQIGVKASPRLDKAQKSLSALKTLEQAMSTSDVEELSSAIAEAEKVVPESP